MHFGKIGADGLWLLEKLQQSGVDTSAVLVGASATGQAIIQVDDAGQNAIVVVAGANGEVDAEEFERAIEQCPEATWLLVQNETSSVEHAIRAARRRGLRVVLNPAPMDERALRFPLDLVDLLCVNQSEAALLAGKSRTGEIVESLAARWPRSEIVVTLGAEGRDLPQPAGCGQTSRLCREAAGYDRRRRYFFGLLPGLPRSRDLHCREFAHGLSGGRAVRHAGRGNRLDSAEGRSRGVFVDPASRNMRERSLISRCGNRFRRAAAEIASG